jgi:hypothetical protein
MIKNKKGLFALYISRIKDRLLVKNKNWLCVVVGDTGSGKSYSAISLGCEISGEERVFVVLTPKEFLELLNSGKLKKGDTIIADEFGVSMNSRDWYSIQNKLLGAVLQTFRNLNVAVIFTTPNLDFIDSMARKLFHCLMITQQIDYDRSVSYLKPYDIVVNQMFGKTFYNFPVFTIDKQYYKMKYIGLSKPSVEMCERYEKMKNDYTKKLNAESLAEINDIEEKNKPKVELSTDQIIEAIRKEEGRFKRLGVKKKKFDMELIKNVYNIPFSKARLVKKSLET